MTHSPRRRRIGTGQPLALAMALILALMLGLALVHCGPEDPPTNLSAARIRLALNWFPEAEHGGYFAAEVGGHYARERLSVDIQAGGPDAPVIQRVTTGAVEFGVTNADEVLYARAQQAPVIALLAPYQINPRCIMVHAESGIDSLGKLANITLAMSQRPAFAHFLRRRFGLSGVTIVPYPGSIVPFLSTPDYAQQAYVFSEPFLAQRQGAATRTFLVAEAGFNPYASVLITTEALLAQQPQMVAAVVRATRAGWAEYLGDPGPANQRIHELNPEMDLEALAFGARASGPLCQPATDPPVVVGSMTTERWQTLARQMVECGLLAAGAVDPEQAFTNRFLPAGP
jgi:NitT/TauT family transport system substrate-binding protein